jgi:hypothetical protein
MDNGTLTDKQKFIQVVRDAIDKLEKQGVQSKDRHSEACAYRGENNTRCIIEFMIENEDTAFQWDCEQFILEPIAKSWDCMHLPSPWHSLKEDESAVAKKLKELSTEIGVEVDREQILLLSFLQSIHDVLACGETFSYKTLNIILNAKEWNLQDRISLMRRAVELYEVSLE